MVRNGFGFIWNTLTSHLAGFGVLVEIWDFIIAGLFGLENDAVQIKKGAIYKR